ncbi:MAG: class I SAM-dependent methyltransferase, partial [Proteobacteria bacterium]|nr:class I SAM-dependent methyltransferase [Pseudomonadota bacterium]
MKIHSDNKTPHKSDEYDLKVRQTIPYYESFHNETIDLINTINPNVNTWLDTGCGTGSLIDSAVNKFPNCTFIL